MCTWSCHQDYYHWPHGRSNFKKNDKLPLHESELIPSLFAQVKWLPPLPLWVPTPRRRCANLSPEIITDFAISWFDIGKRALSSKRWSLQKITVGPDSVFPYGFLQRRLFPFSLNLFHIHRLPQFPWAETSIIQCFYAWGKDFTSNHQRRFCKRDY